MRFSALASLALLGAATPLTAQTFLFEIDGDAAASFIIDVLPTAVSEPDGIAFYADVLGDFGGFGIADIYFYSADAVPPGGIVIDDFVGGSGLLIDAGGPVLFTGPLDAPVFTPGTFALTEIDMPGSYRLRITAVPEPATWAMMIAGFGAAGATMRRARPVAA